MKNIPCRLLLRSYVCLFVCFFLFFLSSFLFTFVSFLHCLTWTAPCKICFSSYSFLQYSSNSSKTFAPKWTIWGLSQYKSCQESKHLSFCQFIDILRSLQKHKKVVSDNWKKNLLHEEGRLSGQLANSCSAIPSKNTVSTDIKHSRYFH